MEFDSTQINSHDGEADAYRKEVLPKLYDSGWTDDLILNRKSNSYR